MAKAQATGLTIHGGSLRWTTMRGTRAGAPVVIDSRTVQLQLEAGQNADLSALSETDRATVVPRIKAARGSMHGNVTIALSSEHVLVRVAELPAVDRAELASMVELQVDKFSPFPAESATTSFEVLRQSETSSHVLVATVQIKDAEAAGNVLTEAGILPRRLDVETLCWLRLISDAGAIPESGCHIAVLRDKTTCDAVVTRDGIPIVFRSLGRSADISDEELSSEIDYTLTGLENDHGIVGVDSISLWHWDAAPSALLGMLKDRFHSAVQAHAFDSLPPLSEGITRRALDQAGTCINLSVPEWHAGEAAARLRKNLVNASLAATAIWILGVGGLLGLVQFEKHRVGPMEQMATSLRKIEAKSRDANDLLVAARQYSDTKYSSVSCLREVCALKPDDIEFDSFTYNKAFQPFKRDLTTARKTRHEPVKTNQVIIVCHSQSQNSLRDFQNSLQKESKLFTRVTPGRMSQKGQDLFSFTITADLPRKKNETP